MEDKCFKIACVLVSGIISSFWLGILSVEVYFLLWALKHYNVI